MKRANRVMMLAVAAALGAASGGAAASGFQLIEQNASGLGNAYAGQAAIAADASTVFFNPAGMAWLPGTQFVVAGNFIRPSAKFTNTASTTAPRQTNAGDNGGDAGDWALVPNLYFAMPVSPSVSLGLGVNAPFGLKTDYDANFMGRFYALKSEVKTYNINPSISYKFNDKVAIGGGVNYQHVTAELTNAVNYSGIIGAGSGLAGTSSLNGSDSAWGWNIGGMFQVTPDTRLGLTYRSAIGYKLSGTVGFSNRPAALAAALPDGGITADLKVPGTVSAAVFSRVSPKVDVMADLSWTQWSSFQNLTVFRTSGAMLSTTPENWRDTWRVGVGVTYHHNEAFSGKAGIAYDQAPVPDAYRTPRIPDNDRFWLALGGQYRVSKKGAIDFGYAHLFVRNSSINLPASTYPASAALYGRLVGNYSDDVNIVSVQYTHTF
jgi:long-chain fatty acid transport protein